MAKEKTEKTEQNGSSRVDQLEREVRELRAELRTLKAYDDIDAVDGEDRMRLLRREARIKRQARISQEITDTVARGERALSEGPKQFRIHSPQTLRMERIVGSTDAANAKDKYVEHFGLNGWTEVGAQPIVESLDGLSEDEIEAEIQRCNKSGCANIGPGPKPQPQEMSTAQ